MGIVIDVLGPHDILIGLSRSTFRNCANIEIERALSVNTAHSRGLETSGYEMIEI